MPDYPEVLVLSNDMKDGKPVGLIDGGDFWHSDSSHRDTPSMATILYAVKNPRQGGDTEFANMYAAYDALPDRDETPHRGFEGHSRGLEAQEQARDGFSAPAGRQGFLREAEISCPIKSGRWCEPIR